MCCGCWAEHGSPTIDSPAIRETVALIEVLYNDTPNGGAGGNLHIVTDDFNIETDHLEFCIGQIAQKRAGFGDQSYAADPRQLEIEARIMELMLPMSEAERASALGLVDGCWKLS